MKRIISLLLSIVILPVLTSATTVLPVSLVYLGDDINVSTMSSWDTYSISCSDLLTMVEEAGVSQSDFENYYSLCTGSNGACQYLQDTNGDYYSTSQNIGSVTESGSGLIWEVSGSYLRTLYTGKAIGTYSGIAATVKYECKWGASTTTPDIYITFKSGNIKVTSVIVKPTAVAFTNADKENSVWYSSNSAVAGTGYDELHINSVSPDLSGSGISNNMSYCFSDAFTNQYISLNSVSGFSESNATLNFVFSDTNYGPYYGAYRGTLAKYTLSVSSDGKTLYATRYGSGTKEAVATITGSNINSQKITYQKTESAEALLNYASSENLTDNVIKAVIELKVTLNDGTAVSCTGNTFVVRFIRPINVLSKNAEITNSTEKVYIKLTDLMTLTDHNGKSFNNTPSYWNAYNIKSVKVLGSTSGTLINGLITTDYNNADISTKLLADATGDVMFKCFYNTYDALSGTSIDLTNIDFGYISYENLSDNLSGFKVRIPIAVEYEWGTQVVYSDLTIKESQISVAFTDNSKISNYWYKTNGNSGNDIGYDEIHAQTIVPEDPYPLNVGYARDLNDMFSDVFVNNKIEVAYYYGNTESYTTRLVFSSLNSGKTYKGYYGNTVVSYEMSVSDDGLTLYANYGGKTQAVAVLTGSDDINQEQIVYQKTDFAFALLNYAAHNELTDDVVKAIIEMKVQTPTLDVPCTNNTFDVRFLRPINVKTQDMVLRKGTSATYKIPFTALVNEITDWREYSFSNHPNYYNYYNIKSIKVLGCSTSGLSINKYVTSDVNGGDIINTRLSDVCNQVQLIAYYKTYDYLSSSKLDVSNLDFGYISYRNVSSSEMSPFSVRIPLAVEYEWGTVVATVDVKFDSYQEVAITGISLDTSSFEISAGESRTLVTTVSPIDASSTEVIWTSSNTSVAKVDQNGKVTGVGKGTATITATAADGSGYKASCSVTVTTQLVSSITLAEHSITATIGDTYTLIATVLPANATQTLNWSTSNSMIASVSQTGVISFNGVGTATITATTTDGTNLSDECQITVNPRYAESITVSPSSAILEEGETVALNATIYPLTATYKDIAWSSSDKSVATVSASGVVTALQAGETTIYARTTDGTSLSAQCHVTVNQPKVSQITLSRTQAELYEGEVLQLTAVVSPDNAANKQIKWTSNDESIATVENGLVTALKAGSVTIKATSTDGSNVSASCYLTVKPILVQSVSFAEQTTYVHQGDTLNIDYTVSPSNASNPVLSWYSSDETVATVSNGVLRALKQGAVIITACSTDGSGITVQCIVIVQEPNGIAGISSDFGKVNIYTLDGRQVNTIPLHGTYIIRSDDGKVRKVYRK